jgi:hypothetical protein
MLDRAHSYSCQITTTSIGTQSGKLCKAFRLGGSRGFCTNLSGTKAGDFDPSQQGSWSQAHDIYFDRHGISTAVHDTNLYEIGKRQIIVLS